MMFLVSVFPTVMVGQEEAGRRTSYVNHPVVFPVLFMQSSSLVHHGNSTFCNCLLHCNIFDLGLDPLPVYLARVCSFCLCPFSLHQAFLNKSVLKFFLLIVSSLVWCFK